MTNAKAARYPTHDDPLGITDVGEKLRQSELRTLFCVSEIMRLTGDTKESHAHKDHANEQDASRFAIAGHQVAACLNKICLQLRSDAE